MSRNEHGQKLVRPARVLDRFVSDLCRGDTPEIELRLQRAATRRAARQIKRALRRGYMRRLPSDRVKARRAERKA